MKISFSYPSSRIDVPISTPHCAVLIPLSSATAQVAEVRENYETNVNIRVRTSSCNLCDRSIAKLTLVLQLVLNPSQSLKFI